MIALERGTIERLVRTALGRQLEGVGNGQAPIDIRGLPDAAEPGELLGMEVGLRGPGDCAGDPPRERGEREDVVAIVREDPRERARSLAPEVLEVHRGDQGPWKVVISGEAEHVSLERSQAAVGEACAPEWSKRLPRCDHAPGQPPRQLCVG